MPRAWGAAAVATLALALLAVLAAWRAAPGGGRGIAIAAAVMLVVWGALLLVCARFSGARMVAAIVAGLHIGAATGNLLALASWGGGLPLPEVALIALAGPLLSWLSVGGFVGMACGAALGVGLAPPRRGQDPWLHGAGLTEGRVRGSQRGAT